MGGLPSGGGLPGGGDKPPGNWKFHEVTGATEARAKIEDLLADDYHVAIVAYKYEE